MAIGGDTHVSWGRLPHLTRPDKTYFVTFCKHGRAVLPDVARDLVLESCLYDHERLHWLDCVVVMPDHVHLLVSPYPATTLREIVASIKSASVHRVNRLLGRKGTLWQRESFDHILRSEESRSAKAEYIANNPVRKGLVARAEDYRWYWRPG